MKITKLFSPLLLPVSLLISLSELRGQVGNDNPTGPAGMFNGNVTTGSSYDPYTGNATRTITDMVVAGAVGAYGLSYSRTWNTRDTGWRNSYDWAIEDIEDVPAGDPMDRIVSFPDGRSVNFGSMIDGNRYFLSPPGVPERLRAGAPGTSLCHLILSDGGQVEFHVTATSYFDWETQRSYYSYYFSPQAIVDPYGQRTTLTYPNGNLKVTEPGGRWIQIFNNTEGIDYIQASDGRIVDYTYETRSFSPGTQPYTVLKNITYFGDAAITATYNYQSPNVGSANGQPLLATCDDPMYAGPMRAIAYEYATGAGAVYGQILREKHPNGTHVSSLSVSGNSRTETRGDGATRTFNYANGRLTSFTDFKNQTSSISYDANGYVWSTTDARGHTTTTQREPLIGAVALLTHPDQSTRAYSYPAGNPYFVQYWGNERGKNTYLTRDGNNRIIRIDYPDYPNGAYETFTYNGFGQILTHRLTSGGTESFTYDAGNRGLKKTWTNAENKTTNYNYDALDRLSSVTDPRGNTTSFQYNSRGQVTRITHADGNFVQYGYDGHGNLTSVTDELNHTRSYGYDDYRRVISVANSLNQTTSYDYRLDWINSYLHTTGSVKAITSPMGKPTHFAYDENFRGILLREAAGTADDAWTYYGYDAVGNLTSVLDPRGYTTSFGYDNRNRQTTVTDALNQTTATTYDAAGNKLSVTRPGNSAMQYPDYDSMNRLTRQIDERNVTTTMGYDSNGNLAWSNDGNGNHYSYEYDYLSRRKKMIYPDTSNEFYSYDAAGNLETYTNRAGKAATFQYDNRNRQTWFDWGGEGTQPRLTIYDAASRVTGIQNWDADITLTYNDANRKTSETETIKSYGLYATRSTAYQYDADGNRTRVAYPQGYQFIYAYTNRNQLDNIKLDPAIFGGYYNTPLVRYTYDISGNRTARTVISGAHAEYDIDNVNRVRTQANYFANGQVGRFDYGFDAMGRRRYEQRDWGTADGFQYDQSDQVTSYKRDGTLNGDGTVTAPFWNANILTYDNNGNRTAMTGPGGASYSPNHLNQYESVSSLGNLGYDGKGNLTSGAGWTYGYDAQNRLITADNDGANIHIRNTYDGMNRIVTRNLNGAVTQNVWDGWNLVQEHRPDWSIQRCYLQGAQQNEMVVAFDGNVYSNHWFWQDGRGNTSHITGDPGNLLERYTYDLSGAPKFYDEWGSERWGGSAYDTRFLFGGSQYMPESGLYDMRNRFYHPGVGRFLQPDPIGFAGDPSNLYRYCGGDPVNGVDPFGLKDWKKRLKEFFTAGGSRSATTPRVTVIGTPVGPETAETAGLGSNAGGASTTVSHGDSAGDLGRGERGGAPEPSSPTPTPTPPPTLKQAGKALVGVGLGGMAAGGLIMRIPQPHAMGAGITVAAGGAIVTAVGGILMGIGELTEEDPGE